MKIAIHYINGDFSIRWVSYCRKHNIDYKLVDCYQNDIIEQLHDCHILLWHHSQSNYKDVLFAKQLLFSLQFSGIKVFPDFNTCWHFDDKIGQKYLLESIGAPLVPTYIFYSKSDALEWLRRTSFPKVFKLRGGAGSENVKLVHSSSCARKLIEKAFRKGFPAFSRLENLKERVRKYIEGKGSANNVIRGLARLFILSDSARLLTDQKGYVYFQDFIPNNNFDIRVIVISGRAFAIKRIVRKNDFRASGSGNILYEKDNIPIDTIRLSFSLNEKLQSQCIAFDFVYDDNNPLVVEISYGFSMYGYDRCVGYWDKSLFFHEGAFNPQDWIIENLINDVSA